MRPSINPSSTDQSAAFALFEAVRQAQGLSVSPDGSFRATFLRAVDPAVAGLAWTSTDDTALQLRWGDVPAGFAETMWVHATWDDRGPKLSLYMNRERPVLQLRFSGASFEPLGNGRHLLRERVTWPSHDGRHEEREALTRHLAKAWRVPMDGPWLHVGEWDALDARWEPEAARRLLAIALILVAAKNLDAAWLEA